MVNTVLIIINVIIIFVGIHFKKYNDSHQEDYEMLLYSKFVTLKRTNSSKYYRKLTWIVRKLKWGLSIRPYEKKLIQKYLIERRRELIRERYYRSS